MDYRSELLGRIGVNDIKCVIYWDTGYSLLGSAEEYRI
jgi:hypothetical protein